MKKIIYLVLLGLCIQFPRAYSQERTLIDSKPSHVTIFTKGATLSQSGSINLKKGTNQVEFKGISSKVDADRILLQFSGNAKVVALTETAMELSALDQNTHYKNIKDSIQLIQMQINETHGMPRLLI